MLTGKVIVVTGGAGLLGRAFCKAICANGGIAVVADIDIDAATGVAVELVSEFPGRAQPACLDIASKDSLTALISNLHQQHGHIDALVNNAYPRNGNYGRKLEQVTYEDFCENVGMHLGGYFLATQQFGVYFCEQGRGNVINMASVYGVVPPRFEIYEGTSMTMPVEYAAIKSAIIHLTKYFAVYLKGRGIRVNSLSPGGIINHQDEMFVNAYKRLCNGKGMLDANDVAGSLTFLLSDASLHVTGQNFVIDDGFTL